MDCVLPPLTCYVDHNTVTTSQALTYRAKPNKVPLMLVNISWSKSIIEELYKDRQTEMCTKPNCVRSLFTDPSRGNMTMLQVQLHSYILIKKGKPHGTSSKSCNLTFNSDIGKDFKVASGGGYIACVVTTVILIYFADDKLSIRDFILIGRKTDP